MQHSVLTYGGKMFKKIHLIILIFAFLFLLTNSLSASSNVSDKLIKKTIDDLIDAYISRSLEKFMSSVDESYTGDKALLDDAIRKDFSLITDISISYTINSIIPDFKEMVLVSLKFTRTYTDITTGTRNIDEGSCTMIFKIINNKPFLYSMRDKPLFGFK